MVDCGFFLLINSYNISSFVSGKSKMKNKLVIDIDDERDRKVIIQKLEEPDSDEEVFELLKTDIETACEGLMSLLTTASDNDVSDKERNIRYVLSHLMKTYPDNKYLDTLKDIVQSRKKNTYKERIERRQWLFGKKNGPKRSKTLKKIN